MGSDEEGMFDWLKLLQKIDDNKLKRICGTDAALYLIFLRYSSIYFSVISCINIIFIWIYVTGKPIESDDYQLEHEEAQYSL
jgi:hypothetical protein